MDLDDYQRRAASTAVYFPKDRVVYPTLALCGEAGELANKVKKVLRDDPDNDFNKAAPALLDELGDVMWYVAAIATDLGTSLSTVAQMNMQKLADRKARGVLHGSGDNR